MVEKEKVVVFMKGVPEAPQCGFSNAVCTLFYSVFTMNMYFSHYFLLSTQVCQIMRMHDVPFTGHNVLADEELRQGIKEFSNWPTIPQVY